MVVMVLMVVMVVMVLMVLMVLVIAMVVMMVMMVTTVVHLSTSVMAALTIPPSERLNTIVDIFTTSALSLCQCTSALSLSLFLLCQLQGPWQGHGQRVVDLTTETETVSKVVVVPNGLLLVVL